MAKSLRCVSYKVRRLPYYDGLTDVDNFMDAFEREVPEKHRFQVLHLALHATPTQWWGMHKDRFEEWCNYRRMMRMRFCRPKVRFTEKYDGRNDPLDHLAKWIEVYGEKPPP